MALDMLYVSDIVLILFTAEQRGVASSVNDTGNQQAMGRDWPNVHAARGSHLNAPPWRANFTWLRKQNHE